MYVYLKRQDSSLSHRAGQGGSVRGAVCVLLSAVCFSLAGVIVKAVDWNAFSISGARSVFAAAVLYAYLRLRGGHLVVNRAVVAGAALNFVMAQTFIIANKLTTAANAIVLQFTMPAWLILFLWLLFGERPRRAAVVACVVIFAGTVCFFADRLEAGGMLGNVLAVVSGVAYAGVFLIKRIPGCDFESAAVLSFLACAACGVPTLVHETDFSMSTLALIAVLGVVQVGLAYVFLSMGLDLVSPVTASLISTVEPVLNPVLVAVVIGETIGPLSFAGAVLVIAAAAAYNAYDARQPQGP